MSRPSSSVSWLTSRFESPSVVAQRRAEEAREVRRILDKEDERRRAEQEEQRRQRQLQLQEEERLRREEEERVREATKVAEKQRLAQEKQVLLGRLKAAEEAFQRVKKASLALSTDDNDDNNNNKKNDTIDKEEEERKPKVVRRSGAVVSRLPAKFFGDSSCGLSRGSRSRAPMSRELFNSSLDAFEPESKRVEAKSRLRSLTDLQRSKQQANWSNTATVPDLVIDTMNERSEGNPNAKENMQNYLIAKVLYDDIHDSNNKNNNNFDNKTNKSKNESKSGSGVRKEEEMEREVRQYLESVGAHSASSNVGNNDSNCQKSDNNIRNVNKSMGRAKVKASELERNEHALLTDLTDIKQRLKFGALATVKDKEKVRKFDAMVNELQGVQSVSENVEKNRNFTQTRRKPTVPKQPELNPTLQLDQVHLKPTQVRRRADLESVSDAIEEKKSPFGEEVRLRRVTKPNLRRLKDIVAESKSDRMANNKPLRPARSQRQGVKTGLKSKSNDNDQSSKLAREQHPSTATKTIASTTTRTTLTPTTATTTTRSPRSSRGSRSSTPKKMEKRSGSEMLDELGELIRNNSNLVPLNLIRSFDRLEYKVFRRQDYQSELNHFCLQTQSFLNEDKLDKNGKMTAFKRDVSQKVQCIKEQLMIEANQLSPDGDCENWENFENLGEFESNLGESENGDIDEAMLDMQHYLRSLDKPERQALSSTITTTTTTTTTSATTSTTPTTSTTRASSASTSLKRRPVLADHDNLDAFLDDMDDYLKTLENSEKKSVEEELEQYLNEISVEESSRPRTVPKITSKMQPTKSILEDESFLKRELERKRRMEQIRAMQNNRTNNKGPVVPERRCSLKDVDEGTKASTTQPAPPTRRDSLTKTNMSNNVLFTATPNYLTNPPMGNELVSLAVGLNSPTTPCYEASKADASFLQPKPSIEEEIAAYRARDKSAKWEEAHIRGLALRQKARMQNDSNSSMLNLKDEEGGKVWKWKQKAIDENNRIINEYSQKAKPVQRHHKAMKAFSTMFARNEEEKKNKGLVRSTTLDFDSDDDSEEKEEEEKEDLSYLRGSCANVRAKFEAQIRQDQQQSPPSMDFRQNMRKGVLRSASCTSFAEHLRQRPVDKNMESSEVTVQKGLVNAMRNQVLNQCESNKVKGSRGFNVPEEERSAVNQAGIRRQLELRASLSSAPKRSQEVSDLRRLRRNDTKFERKLETKSETRNEQLMSNASSREYGTIDEDDELPDISGLLSSHKYSDSREGIAAELAEVRKVAKTRNLMSINNRTKNNKTNNAQNRSSRPSLLDKSYSTTSVDMDESVLENVSRNKALIKNKIKQIEEDNKNVQVTSCRPRVMPHNRRWVLDTVNKYFEPIAEESNNLSKSVPKKLNSDRMQAFEARSELNKSESESLVRSASAMSGLLRSSSSSQMRDRLKSIMEKKPNLDLSHFKRNLSDHLRNGQSRENSMIFDSDQEDDNDLYTKVTL